MNTFLQQIGLFLRRLSLVQKLTLGGVLGGGLLALVGIALWASQPNYALLFGGLEPTDASRIVEALKSESLPYQLKENGTAIYVPQEQVYELRLRFASDGLGEDQPTGYELFDQGTLGMTDFMQKLNLKRALEGELARTIASLGPVEMARVHLVTPERSAFRASQTHPSASVVLQLKGGARLQEGQIEGITALVSGAVEGLSASDVTVLDTRGTLLSNPNSGNADAQLTGTQLEMQHAMETSLAEKGQSMLDQMLGQGNAIVRVSATLDFTRSVQEKEQIDPESATVISEEELQEPVDDAGQVNATSSVKNYDLTRTRERNEHNGGTISYLTVSVILNQKLPPIDPENPDSIPPAQPYTDEELQNLERVVKNAVGFNEERGDRFALHQTRFDTSGQDQVEEELEAQQFSDNLQLWLRYGLMALALLGALWLMRSATRRATEIRQAEASGLLTGGDSAAVSLPAVPLPAVPLPAVPLPAVSLPAPTAPLLAGPAPSPLHSAPPLTASHQIETHLPEPEEHMVFTDDFYPSKSSSEAAMQVSAFQLLQTVETNQLANFLQNEHPQTAALILSHLTPRKTAEVIANFTPELQSEIVYRLATMGRTSPAILNDIEEVIREQIGSLLDTDLGATGGIEKVAAILNNASRSMERTILDGLRDRNPDLATGVKALMFVFDDLISVGDRDLQRIMTEVEQKDLILSLKGASPDLGEKILSNLSERAAGMIREELEMLGGVKVRDVEEAQRRVLEVAQRLEASEEISLNRSGNAEMI
jgi:flagellar M-ring protein FliF